MQRMGVNCGSLAQFDFITQPGRELALQQSGSTNMLFAQQAYNKYYYLCLFCKFSEENALRFHTRTL